MLELQLQLFYTVRFVLYVTTAVLAVIVMLRADDNTALRRVSAILAAVITYFNKEIGEYLYLVLGSLIQTIITLSGVGFIICLALAIMVLPLVFVVRRLTH